MPHRVLIVDDDPDSRSICTTFLRHFRYEVVEAWDGEEAVRLAADVRPDVIVMDITLPRLDGWEATRRIRANPSTRGIPIVMLTARALAMDRDESHRAGCTVFLTKPCSPRELQAELERLLGDRSPDGQGAGST